MNIFKVYSTRFVYFVYTESEIEHIPRYCWQ